MPSKAVTIYILKRYRKLIKAGTNSLAGQAGGEAAVPPQPRWMKDIQNDSSYCRLITTAICVMAVLPRTDFVKKVNDFISDVQPQNARHRIVTSLVLRASSVELHGIS